jgi:hypothetical protein
MRLGQSSRASCSGRPELRTDREPRFKQRAGCMTPSPRLRGEGWGEGQALRLSQVLLHLTRLLAGGSPAASDFLLSGQEKVTKRKATPFAGLRLPAAARLKPGNAETRFAINFQGSQARTSALLLTVLTLPSAAASEGTAKGNLNFPSPRVRGEGGPQGRVRGKVSAFTSPLCRVGRMAELGDLEASVSEHVATRQGGSCELASRPIQTAGRGLPEGRHSGVPFSFAPFFWASKRKGPAAGLPPANEPSNCDAARIDSRTLPSPQPDPLPASGARGSMSNIREVE